MSIQITAIKVNDIHLTPDKFIRSVPDKKSSKPGD